MSLGLKSVIYFVADLEAAKDWYADAFEVEPYFDEPFYVGFRVGHSELGLDPDLSIGMPGPGGSVAYWGVADIVATLSPHRGDGRGIGRADSRCWRWAQTRGRG